MTTRVLRMAEVVMTWYERDSGWAKSGTKPRGGILAGVSVIVDIEEF